MLNPAELASVEAAVRAAEARTKGEIYCVIAPDSSDYRETPLAWAAAVALLAPALLLLAGIVVRTPDILAGWTAAHADVATELAARNALAGAILLQGLLFGVTAVIVALPRVRVAVTPKGLKRDRVERRARDHFLAKNLHLTRERTGVLIFVSAAEHMAEIVADQTIAEKVAPDAWEAPMKVLTDGLKAGRAVDGFVGAVALCADILAVHIPADADNPNELPDAVVVLD
jgi:putative membrane protein